MRQSLRMLLTMSSCCRFCVDVSRSGRRSRRSKSEAVAVEDGGDQEIDVRYHLKALEVYVNELEKADDADRRTNPKYAEEVGYLETRRRLMAATVEDFEMGRASTDDYRRCSEELAELELQSIIRHEERLKAAKSHVARMTELAKTVKAREVGTIGEREMLEGKAAQEKAERLLRNVQTTRHNTRLAR